MTHRRSTLIRRIPDRVQTVTADNGTESHDYPAIEPAPASPFYFATPYPS